MVSGETRKLHALLRQRGDTGSEGLEMQDEIAILLAARLGNAAAIEEFCLSAPQSITRLVSQTPNLLNVAAVFGQSEVIRVLVTHMPTLNIDPRDGDCNTPAHYAATHGHDGVLTTLFALNSKAANAVSAYDNTPLDCAARLGHLASSHHRLGEFKQHRCLRGELELTILF